MIDLKTISTYLGYIVGIGTSLCVIYKWLAKPLQEIKAENKSQSEKLNKLSEDQKLLFEDTADLLCSQLTTEHDYYIRRGWCSSADKRRLDDVYTRYKKRGRNHVASSYMDDIVRLPEHDPKEV